MATVTLAPTGPVANPNRTRIGVAGEPASATAAPGRATADDLAAAASPDA